MAYTFPVVNSLKSYFEYVFKRLKRLAPGYLLFGVLIYLGKSYLSSTLQVDDVPGDVYSEMYNLLIVPSKSAGGSLWFVYVLMEMYIIFPLIILFLIHRPVLIILIGVLIAFVPVTDSFMLDRFCEYFLFFSIGVVVVQSYEKYLCLIDKYSYIFLALFILSFLSMSYFSQIDSKIIIGIFSLPALHSFMRNGFLGALPVWELFGKYTYSIYLMNTILIGIAKGFMLTFFSWEGAGFLLMAPVLLVAGLYGAIFIKSYILPRYKILDRITS